MKNSPLLVLILSVFVSCKSNNKQPVQDATATPQTTNNTKLIIEKFKPIIQGVWVKSDYVDKVIKTKSPLAAADETAGMTTMYINTDKIMGDSLVVLAGDNHEGTEFTLKFKAGKRKATILLGSGELGYSINNGDTVLTTYIPDENNSNKLIATNYRRALIKQGDNLGYGLDYIINKGLIAGNYNSTDSAGNVSKVSFNAEGSVRGFLNFKTYNINIDLNSDVMDNLDEIGFDTDGKNGKSYSFKFNADTLKLYTTKPNADSTTAVLDKLKYKLVRQK
ncbi:hypothetical protein [Mucilaginibacter sp. SP1R1]|uniref:hypothetical protein n=1 Tax=Mucilaginibacter sp. SP1R1 TaxID=2723091 RepID=UPI001612F042|nr:hypothetical protein [Mucilaginibacter sp. SP1R1]MBB6150940.1 hypothetical protein [Mucilaginibacter sp. SP1R1]